MDKQQTGREQDHNSCTIWYCVADSALQTWVRSVRSSCYGQLALVSVSFLQLVILDCTMEALKHKCGSQQQSRD